MWGGLLIYTGHQQKVTALDNFRTSRKADRPPAGCRATDTREECWHVFYDDVRVGSIAIRTGNPHDPWEWHCGFYPGSNPGEQQNGTAATFDEARADFERAWQAFLSKRTEADFQAWRDQRDWTARKYALWDAGKRLEPPSYGPGKPCSRFMKCPCGEVFDMHGPEEVLVHLPHITAAGAKANAASARCNQCRT
jgi:hypothetical protein